MAVQFAVEGIPAQGRLCMVANGIANPFAQDDPMNHIFMRYN
jgi:hypothetical protein